MVTTKDFNEKYKDYLKEGHYGLSFAQRWLKTIENFLNKEK